MKPCWLPHLHPQLALVYVTLLSYKDYCIQRLNQPKVKSVCLTRTQSQVLDYYANCDCVVTMSRSIFVDYSFNSHICNTVQPITFFSQHLLYLVVSTFVLTSTSAKRLSINDVTWIGRFFYGLFLMVTKKPDPHSYMTSWRPVPKNCHCMYLVWCCTLILLEKKCNKKEALERWHWHVLALLLCRCVTSVMDGPQTTSVDLYLMLLKLNNQT